MFVQVIVASSLISSHFSWKLSLVTSWSAAPLGAMYAVLYPDVSLKIMFVRYKLVLPMKPPWVFYPLLPNSALRFELTFKIEELKQDALIALVAASFLTKLYSVRNYGAG